MNQILKPSIDKDDSIECEYCKNKLYRKIIEWGLYGVRIDIWTHFMRGCIIDYVH